MSTERAGSRPPGGLEGKASACNAGDPDSIPGSGRSPGEGRMLAGAAWKSLKFHKVKTESSGPAGSTLSGEARSSIGGSRLSGLRPPLSRSRGPLCTENYCWPLLALGFQAQTMSIMQCSAEESILD